MNELVNDLIIASAWFFAGLIWGRFVWGEFSKDE